MKIQYLLSLVVLLTGLRTFADAPDFTLEAYRGNKKLPLVGVLIKAPAKHHFNVKAPMSAKTVATSTELHPTTVTDHEIRFEVEDASIPAQDSIAVEAYLCDDAKTFCIKKTGSVAIASAAPKAPPSGNLNKVVSDVELPNAKGAQKRDLTPKAEPATKPTTKPEAKARKDEHGFWDNAPDAARAESKKSGKPLLIDFYGIWCPPCNLFNEVVFPTREFKTEAKNFVLLKMDADAPGSWTLKSHFKIGGYPTIVFATSDLDEIDRAIGFFPKGEFVDQMKEAYAHRSMKIEDRVMSFRTKFLDGLQGLVESKWDQKDYKEAARFVQEGLKAQSDDQLDDPFFKVMDLALKAKEDEKVLKSSDSIAFLKQVHDNRAKASTAALLWYQYLMTSSDFFTSDQVLWAADAIDEVKSRINPKTLQIDGREMSLADLDALRVDTYETAKKPDLEAKAVKDTIASYRRLMKQLNDEKSRGLNLELAYFLGKDGQLQAATDIYEGFIKKFPKEFTYYFAAARHYQDNVKDLKRARECGDLAVQYAYGDNKLRSMARLLGIRAAQGDAQAGIAQAREILAQVPKYDGLSVRTGRYVAALEKEIDKASGKGTKK
ncbi:MAG: thioredoxin family protein [Bdellovibrionales bacterium]|nr:thioredoxin family protein [Bdellovibrionales bacterium]